eukprot:scaffold3274_cov244-Pinguiococcus_pyrenoidosus.AAC.10
MAERVCSDFEIGNFLRRSPLDRFLPSKTLWIDLRRSVGALDLAYRQDREAFRRAGEREEVKGWPAQHPSSANVKLIAPRSPAPCSFSGSLR